MKHWIYILLVVVACNNSSDNDVTPPPTAATLLTPGKDTTCIPGAVVTDSTTTVTFTWNAGENTDSYVLTLKNLTNLGVTRQTVTATHADVVLKRNTPYSWFITSKNADVADTAISEKWKFYVPGIATATYAPFPATLVAPAFGTVVNTATVNLQWTGSDVDNDIVSYDVYLGTTATPGLLQSGVTAMNLAGVSVTGGTTYYWKVVTKDGVGNVSQSEVYTFSVQ
jgi:hypothetical protein